MNRFISVAEDKLCDVIGRSLWTRINHLMSTAYSFACLAAPPILIGVVLAWTGQGTPVKVAESHTNYVSQAGTPLYLESPVQVDPKAGLIVYNAWITDESGKRVHDFPTMSVNGHRAKAVAVEFPKNLGKGTYYVQGELSYSENPVKTTSIRLGFGRVVIF